MISVVLWLRILAICYNVWVILIFSCKKLHNIINNNERLRSIDKMLKQKCIESLRKSAEITWELHIEPCGLISRETWDRYVERLVNIIREDYYEGTVE